MTTPEHGPCCVLYHRGSRRLARSRWSSRLRPTSDPAGRGQRGKTSEWLASFDIWTATAGQSGLHRDGRWHRDSLFPCHRSGRSWHWKPATRVATLRGLACGRYGLKACCCKRAPWARWGEQMRPVAAWRRRQSAETLGNQRPVGNPGGAGRGVPTTATSGAAVAGS